MVIVNGEKHYVNPSEEFVELCNMAEANNTRISGSTDVQINRKFFALLRKGYEALVEAIDRKREIDEDEDKIRKAWMNRFKGGYGVLIFLIIGIVLLGSFLIIWEEALDELYATYPESKVKNSGYWYVYDVKGSRTTTPEGDAIVAEIRKTNHPIISKLSHFYIWLILSTACCILLYYLMEKKAKKVGHKVEEELRPIIEKKQEELQKFIVQNAEYMVLMPPEYRDPIYIEKILHLYEVGKADTLKECMNLLDTIEFREDIKGQLGVISAELTTIAAELSNTYYF